MLNLSSEIFGGPKKGRVKSGQHCCQTGQHCCQTGQQCSCNEVLDFLAAFLLQGPNGVAGFFQHACLWQGSNARPGLPGSLLASRPEWCSWLLSACLPLTGQQCSSLTSWQPSCQAPGPDRRRCVDHRSSSSRRRCVVLRSSSRNEPEVWWRRYLGTWRASGEPNWKRFG